MAPARPSVLEKPTCRRAVSLIAAALVRFIRGAPGQLELTGNSVDDEAALRRLRLLTARHYHRIRKLVGFDLGGKSQAVNRMSHRIDRH